MNYNENSILETRVVDDIKESFYVKSYQRGYRWSKDEVNRLLDDIYETEGIHDYYLQPIVVKKDDGKYELIDGQQRLTTIFLIYSYINRNSDKKVKFSLCYETREKSQEFLESINESKEEQSKENVDFFYMYNAYICIKEWFNKHSGVEKVIKEYFSKNIKIIWYEVESNEDSIKLFERLNIGKIPLTDSELIKALFLCDKSDENALQETISLQWDIIENELHNDSFWYFLTNQSTYEKDTRIDLLFDLMVENKHNNIDQHFTFFEFYKMFQNNELSKVWADVYQTFLLLKGWYKKKNLYHRIGFLIASNSKTLLDIYKLSKNITKNEFENKLDEEIRNSLKLSNDKNYGDLSYESASDQVKLIKLLLLFNVLSVDSLADESMRFSFEKYKGNDKNKVKWSLEHIHAQHSECLTNKEAIYQWLTDHINSLDTLKNEVINNQDIVVCIEKLKELQSKKEFNIDDRNEFENLQNKVYSLLSEKGESEYLHTIDNLALLSVKSNSAISNSTFDVKRNKIIELDKQGEFIPYCTKKVFLKYYTESNKTHIHFWSKEDRTAYIKAINELLYPKYLEEKIMISDEKEEN